MSTVKRIVSAASILVAAAFVMGNSTGCSSEESTHDDELVQAAEHALTGAQCDYFDVNGTIQICHALGNGTFKILKLSEQACVNAHGDHATDYVTSTNPSSPLYDPTCNGQGCLPEGAPCDATIEPCAGLICQNGFVSLPPAILSFSLAAENMQVDKVTYGLDNATAGPDGSNDGVADLVVRGNVKAIIVDFTYADGSCFPAGIFDTIIGDTPLPSCRGDEIGYGMYTYGLGASLDGGATMVNAATGEMPNLGWGTRTYRLYLPSPNEGIYLRARVILDNDVQLRSDDVILPRGY